MLSAVFLLLMGFNLLLVRLSVPLFCSHLLKFPMSCAFFISSLVALLLCLPAFGIQLQFCVYVFVCKQAMCIF